MFWNFSVRENSSKTSYLSHNCCYSWLCPLPTNVREGVIPLGIHILHSQCELYKRADEKEEIFQPIEVIFYSSERIICLDIADLSCGDDISAELSPRVSSLYSALREHVRNIVSRLRSTAGNAQKVPGLPCPDWTGSWKENPNKPEYSISSIPHCFSVLKFSFTFIEILIKSSCFKSTH